jgi:hypothetical protein
VNEPSVRTVADGMIPAADRGGAGSPAWRWNDRTAPAAGWPSQMTLPVTGARPSAVPPHDASVSASAGITMTATRGRIIASPPFSSDPAGIEDQAGSLRVARCIYRFA